MEVELEVIRRDGIDRRFDAKPITRVCEKVTSESEDDAGKQR
jgi:hypothetical protein